MDRTETYQINRDRHPAVELYWIAESIERGRPVLLYEVSCLFCKRTLITDFKGDIALMVNAPGKIEDFGLALTVRCKQCKQNYRIIVSDSFLG